jgi:hypothetical protein
MIDTKICPYCAEEIKAAAIVCKHCGKSLPGYEEKVKKLIKGERPHEKIAESEAKVEKPSKAISFREAWDRTLIVGLLAALLGIFAAVSTNYISTTSTFLPDIYVDIFLYPVINFFIFRLVDAFLIFLWAWNKQIVLGAAFLIVGAFLFWVNNQSAPVSNIATTTPGASPIIFTATTSARLIPPVIVDNDVSITLQNGITCLRWDQITHEMAGTVCLFGGLGDEYVSPTPSATCPPEGNCFQLTDQGCLAMAASLDSDAEICRRLAYFAPPLGFGNPYDLRLLIPIQIAEMARACIIATGELILLAAQLEFQANFEDIIVYEGDLKGC